MAEGIRNMFTLYPSFERHFEYMRVAFLQSEFVEWVEEQRPKAT